MLSFTLADPLELYIVYDILQILMKRYLTKKIFIPFSFTSIESFHLPVTLPHTIFRTAKLHTLGLCDTVLPMAHETDVVFVMLGQILQVELISYCRDAQLLATVLHENSS